MLEDLFPEALMLKWSLVFSTQNPLPSSSANGTLCFLGKLPFFRCELK